MILFDTETTGLPLPMAANLNSQPRIIEFCAIKLDDKKLKETGMIKFIAHPGIALPEIITKITGLTDGDLKNEKPFASYLPAICEFFLGQRALAAHNLSFDSRLLQFEVMRAGYDNRFPWPPHQICTVEASYPIENRRLSLQALYLLATGTPLAQTHRAEDDVRATAVCFRWLRDRGLIKPWDFLK